MDPLPIHDETHHARLRRLEHVALALVNEATAGGSPGLLDPDIDLLLDKMEALAQRLREGRRENSGGTP